MPRKMIGSSLCTPVTILVVLAAAASVRAAGGDPARGQRAFGACAACHSLQPDRSMTGPSLSGLWNRKAGSLASFPRYSSALKSSGIVWDDKTLDDWLEDPQHVVPGNEMTFPGVKNDQQRADLLAFLREATQAGHASAPSAPQGGQMGGMMMGGGSVPNLKDLDAEDRVQKITYCGDTYQVTTGDGRTRKFWERNLRLKTDSSQDGPKAAQPALVGAGMMGDRADVIFAAPEEISGFISHQC
jgi:cytochrome c